MPPFISANPRNPSIPLAIYFNTVNPLATFDAMQWTGFLHQLASACPKDAGPAVFTARQMIKLWGLDEGYAYSDCEIPSSVGGGLGRGLFVQPNGWLEGLDEIQSSESMNDAVAPTAEVSPLELVPNPADTRVQVSWPFEEAFKTVQVFDASGRLLLLPYEEQNQKSVVLDLETLAPGLYLVRVQTSKGFYQHKLIKE